MFTIYNNCNHDDTVIFSKYAYNILGGWFIMTKIIINGWIEKDEYGEDVSYINDIPIHDFIFR